MSTTYWKYFLGPQDTKMLWTRMSTRVTVVASRSLRCRFSNVRPNSVRYHLYVCQKDSIYVCNLGRIVYGDHWRPKCCGREGGLTPDRCRVRVTPFMCDDVHIGCLCCMVKRHFYHVYQCFRDYKSLSVFSTRTR